MLAQNLSESPDVLEGVVKGRRGDPNDIRFAEIALHAGGFEFGEEFLRLLVDEHGELASTLVRLARGDHGEPARADLIKQGLQVSG